MTLISGRLWRVVLAVFCALVALWLIAPSLIVIPLSFTDKASFVFPPSGWSLRWYENFFNDPTWLRSLGSSLTVGLLVMVVATVAGTAAAVALSRATFRGEPLIRSSLLAPMVVPVIIVAVGLYFLFLELGLLGTVHGFVIAHSVLALPFVLVPVTASLQGFDRRLESAAAICGASKWTTFRQITLPLVAPGVISGALFAFVTSFDEVVISLFIQSPYLQTLPVKMYASVTRDIDPTIAAASTLIIVFTTAITLAVTLFIARRNRA